MEHCKHEVGTYSAEPIRVQLLVEKTKNLYLTSLQSHVFNALHFERSPLINVLES